MKLAPPDAIRAEVDKIQKVLDQSGPDGPGSPQPFDMALISTLRANYAIAKLQLKVLIEMRAMMIAQAISDGLTREDTPEWGDNDDGDDARA